MIEPVRIGEPGIRLGQDNELTCARMVQTDLTPIGAAENSRNARQTSELVTHGRAIVAVGDIHVRELMVANSKRTAAEGVEGFAEWTRPCAQKSRFAQHAIKRNRPADIDMTVLAHDPHSGPDRSRGVEERGASIVEFANQGRHITACGP